MEKNRIYSTPVLFSALSGLLFFSFFLQYSLKKHPGSWKEEEQVFILSWCKVGNGLWVLLLLMLLLFGIGKEWHSAGTLLGAEMVGYLLLTLLGIGLIMLVSGFTFQVSSLSQTSSQKKHILTAFIPFWTTLLWCRLKSFQKPYWWVKEAQLRYALIWLLLMFTPSLIPVTILGMLLGFRLLVLLFGKDIIAESWKISLNRSFSIYVEEIVVHQIKKYLSPNYAVKILWGIGFISIVGVIFWIFTASLWWKVIPLIWWAGRMLILWRMKMLLPVHLLSPTTLS